MGGDLADISEEGKEELFDKYEWLPG